MLSYEDDPMQLRFENHKCIVFLVFVFLFFFLIMANVC